MQPTTMLHAPGGRAWDVHSVCSIVAKRMLVCAYAVIKIYRKQSIELSILDREGLRIPTRLLEC